MPVRKEHVQEANSIYFVTFTCYNWLPLFQLTNSYDLVYKWFDYLHTHNIRVAGYVIMPNHVHVLLYFPEMPKTLNTVIGNGKRFMAYEIINRLAAANKGTLLAQLSAGVKERERKKGQLHKVFEESFDAKKCTSTDFIYQKLEYIHHNPTSGKWMLAEDFLSYEHSSAAFYEEGISRYLKLMRIEEVL
ncbi:MAG: transposase [Chitinophagaceae bacterium]